MAKSSFIHLHNHTEYSLLDGAIRIKDMISKAKEFNMPAVAITDHGNMFGVIEFYKECVKSGVKPIIGCEIYISRGSMHDKSFKKSSAEIQERSLHHLILLAKNYTGYKNLLKITSISYLEGFYYKPRIDKSVLKQYSEGLIAMSACLKGEISEKALIYGEEEAEKALNEYLKIFPDRFYLEIMENGIAEQKKVNEILIHLGEKYSIPVVATNDCHYLNKNEAKAHDILLCIQTGKTIKESKRLKFSSDEFYFKSPEIMYNNFSYYPKACENTLLVAEECDVELTFKNYHFPQVELNENETVEDKFEKLVFEGFKERLSEIKKLYNGNFTESHEKKYLERLNQEIKIIKDMGFAGYFLIVQDFIKYAKENDIPVGPGRGSAAGSLVAYSLKITDIDPIYYNLLFERFLNPERVSMPDIDIDFCNRRRDEVIKYVCEKYGYDKVAQIITFGKMKTKQVVRDVGRVLDIPYKEVDAIAKLIPSDVKSLQQAYDNVAELKKLIDSKEEYKELFEIAKVLEGLNRHSSIHAAGIVISNKPLSEVIPLAKMNDGEVVTQFDMKWVEEVGLIKFDFLGLKTLTVIDNAVKLIKKYKNPDFKLSEISLKDKKTYKLISDGNTIGVFQLESRGMRELLKRIKPDKFEDLIAVVALYRPGPLESGMVDEYVAVKHGQKKPSYPLPQLEPILKETYGVILYQEQVMQIAQVLAGYSLGEADVLRKAMGKKKPELMAQHREKFVKGCVSRGIDEKKASEIFDIMEKFAGYGFNKSHSAAYAYIAYQTAYLKAHYPVEFMTALLTEDKDNPDKVIKNIDDSKNLKIKILPPDVNVSELDFTIDGNAIRFGLGAIKNVGEKAINSIIKARKKGKFKDLIDFCMRVDLNKVNKKVIESLIKSGAMDSLKYNRATKMRILDDVLKRVTLEKREKKKMGRGLFSSDNIEQSSFSIKVEEIEEWDEETKLMYEKELIGYYLTDHPLNKYKEILEKFSSTSIESLQENDYNFSNIKLGGIINKLKITKTKKGDSMATFFLEDLTGQVEVLVFPKLYENRKALLKNDNIVFIKGNIDKNENGIKILAENIVDIDEVGEEFSNSIELKVNIDNNFTHEKMLKLNDFIKSHLENGRGKNILIFRLVFPEKGEVIIKSRYKLNDINNFVYKINKNFPEFTCIIE